MAKTIATVLGAVFLLVGLLGFIVPDLLGTHLSMAHNVVHLVSGAAALYFGLKGTLAQARLFCMIFGAVYALLGVVGFLAGSSSAASQGVPGPHDDRMFKVIPGMLELGTMDHVVHILLGAIFLVGAFMTKADVREAVD
jgi:hypothetical protein